jgi:hypothetical protein
MLSQIVSETQEPIFPPASRKSLGRNLAGSRTIWYRPLKVAVQKPSMLMIYRRFRQRSVLPPRFRTISFRPIYFPMLHNQLR